MPDNYIAGSPVLATPGQVLFAKSRVITTLGLYVTNPAYIKYLAFHDATSGTSLSGYDFGTSAKATTLNVNANTLSRTVSGLARVLKLTNQTTHYFTVADSDDLSIGDAAADTACTCIVCGIPYDLTNVELFSRFDLTTGSEKREWRFFIDADSKLNFRSYDNSEGDVYIGKKYDTALTDIITPQVFGYTIDDSEAEAGINLYYNGTKLTVVSNSNGAYTSGENLALTAGNFYTHTDGTKINMSNFAYAMVCFIKGEALSEINMKILSWFLLGWMGTSY